MKKMNFPGIQKDISLKDHCSFKIGGKADFFYNAESADSIPAIIKTAKGSKIPYIIIGSGTNTLFSENGFRGLVIHFKVANVKVKTEEIVADSGALLSQVINEAVNHNLSGLEVLAGIPGTIGGAIYGNAGTREGEIKTFVKEVEVYDPETDKIEKLKSEDLKFGYRKSSLKGSKKIVLRVTLKLNKGKTNPDKIKGKLLERAMKQPKGFSAGSFFKNPNPLLAAGYLLEQAGTKSLQVGGAQISEKHANYIINLENATQKDIVELAKMAKERVKNKFNINLEPEVQVVDEYGARLEI